jgi:hypothetical protein
MVVKRSPAQRKDCLTRRIDPFEDSSLRVPSFRVSSFRVSSFHVATKHVSGTSMASGFVASLSAAIVTQRPAS